MRELLARFVACERGSITLIQLAGLVLLGGLFSLAVDAGSLYLAKRRLQGAVDLAALKATTDLDSASGLVAAGIAQQFAPSEMAEPPTVQLGRFPPSGYTLQTAAALAPDQRFEAGGAPANAVRVTARVAAPLYLARLFYGGQTVVGASATAFNKPLAQLAIRTRVAGFDAAKAAALDSVLSGLLGTSVSLSAAAYQGLADADLRLLGLLDSLGLQLGVGAKQYDAVLAASVSWPELIDSAIAAIQSDPDLAGASAQLTATLTALRGQVGAVGAFSLGDMLALDGDDPSDSGAARINLLDLVHAAAETSNRTNGTVQPVDLTVAGGAVRMWVAVTDSVKSSAIGGPGIEVDSSQIRIYLEINPTQTFSLLGSTISVRLPIYLELARGRAQLVSITCPDPVPQTATAIVDAQSGLARATVADVDSANLHQVAPLAAFPAQLVDVAGLVRVTADGQISIDGQPETLTFTAPFSYANMHTVSLVNPLQSLTSALVGGLNLNVQILGLPFPTALVTDPVLAILGDIAPAVDALIADLLDVLGVELGAMDVSVPYMRCANATLAQ